MSGCATHSTHATAQHIYMCIHIYMCRRCGAPDAVLSARRVSVRCALRRQWWLAVRGLKPNTMQVRAPAAVLSTRRVSMLLRAVQLTLRLAVRGRNLSLSIRIYIYIYIYIYIAGAGTCRRAGALDTARVGLSLRAVQHTLWLDIPRASSCTRLPAVQPLLSAWEGGSVAGAVRDAACVAWRLLAAGYAAAAA
jgi:hypothetical protein